MSSQVLLDLMQQAQTLTSTEKIALVNYLLQDATASDQGMNPEAIDQERARKRKQSVEWIKFHQLEYADQYVALDGDQLLSFGITRKEVVEEVKRMGIQDCFITHVPDPNKVYWGGW